MKKMYAVEVYQEELRDAIGVIRQLYCGPGPVIYIHPYDVHEMINAAENTMYVGENEEEQPTDPDIIRFKGLDYKMTTSAPLQKRLSEYPEDIRTDILKYKTHLVYRS